MILEKINEIEHELSNYYEAKNQYDLAKLKYEEKLLTLKYSQEYQIYKTIKEKEERAKMETTDLQYLLLDCKAHVRSCELAVKCLKLELQYFVDDCCQNNECCCEHNDSEPQINYDEIPPEKRG